MREEVSLLEEDTQLNGTSPHGLPSNGKDHTSSGFTAVNGDSNKYAVSRSDDYHKHKMPQYREISQPLSAAAVAQHTWRPSERTDLEQDHHLIELESAEKTKRKRLEIDTTDAIRQDQPYATGQYSPKRRMTLPEDDDDPESPHRSAQALNSYGSDHRPTTTPVGVYTRERSPVPTRNQREPPPQVRPETEAHLAESLQRSLHGVGSVQPEAGSASPPNESSVLEDQNSYSPEQQQSGDQGDPKKKKRNFSNRTKTGCHTCRRRKKKCDEKKPLCDNCGRGGFTCEGYGPKPAGGFKAPNAKPPVLLQSKQVYESSGPTGHYPPADGRSYSHWGKVPPQQEPEPPYRYGDAVAEELRHPSTRNSWARPAWHDPAAYHHSHETPSVEYGRPLIPPLSAALRDPQPLPVDSYSQYPSLPAYRPQTGPGTVISSHESVASSHSQRTARYLLPMQSTGGPMTHKDMMLLGKPYRPYIDSGLIADRISCKAALERYNNANKPGQETSDQEKGRLFSEIVIPQRRLPELERHHMNGLLVSRGHVGERTIVEAPFNCDYGYNIILGSDVAIGAGCYMQDPCEISIGSRTIVGPSVKFYGNTASVDASVRKEVLYGYFVGGAITVEEDCLIGADVIILPYRTIGRGAVIGAGSVVTKNVEPYTVVAGNPAKVVRSLEGTSGDKRHSTIIQRQNDDMISKMRAARGFTDS